MYVCNRCYNIFNNDMVTERAGWKLICPIWHCGGDLVDVEEEMIPIYKELWNNGYRVSDYNIGIYPKIVIETISPDELLLDSTDDQLLKDAIKFFNIDSRSWKVHCRKEKDIFNDIFCLAGYQPKISLELEPISFSMHTYPEYSVYADALKMLIKLVERLPDMRAKLRVSTDE